MRSRWSGWLLAAVLLGGATASHASVANMNTVKEGDAVPAFKGRSISGEEVDVGALIGKKAVVLAFWSIYCKPCVEEIKSLSRLHDESASERLAIIGVNADGELGVSRIRTFMSRYEEFERRKIPYPNIYDEGNAITKLLGVNFLPTMVSVNLKGQVERIFTGFEEKNEQEILAGIRKLLPEGEAAAAKEDSDGVPFTVEAAAPLCGFYDSTGWKGSFAQNYNLDRETELTAEYVRRKALKTALRDALASLGVSLVQTPDEAGCFRTHGVHLIDDPLKEHDPLSNLLRSLQVERLTKVQESQEAFFGTEYRVNQRVLVNVPALKEALEAQLFQFTPRTVTFSVVNLKQLDRLRFERALVEQSRFIGYASFPTYTIFTSVEEFAKEIKRMDFGGLRLFVEEAADDRIEVEAWK